MNFIEACNSGKEFREKTKPEHRFRYCNGRFQIWRDDTKDYETIVPSMDMQEIIVDSFAKVIVDNYHLGKTSNGGINFT